jgi:SAM-dependent methyltransferase
MAEMDTKTEARAAADMRNDWNRRAQCDAFYYIASWRRDWDTPSFLHSGQEDFDQLAAPFIEKRGLRGTALELGCGAGRMTHCFARRFERVLALDISDEMLTRAREIHSGLANVTWILADGLDWPGVEPASVDFVFCYLVLQHLPSESLVQAYVQKMLSVLRPGGSFLFQFPSGGGPTMNWRGRFIWGVLDTLWSLRLRGLSRRIATALKLDPNMAGKTWHGAYISVARVTEAVHAGGGRVDEIHGADSLRTWCCGTRAEN